MKSSESIGTRFVFRTIPKRPTVLEGKRDKEEGFTLLSLLSSLSQREARRAISSIFPE